MKALHTPPENRTPIHRSLPVFPGLRDSLHLKALSEVILTARRGTLSKLLILFLLALLLAIPATALIFSNGLDKASQNLKQARRISMFIAADTPATVARQLSEKLVTNDYVSTATLITLELDSQSAQAPVMIEVMPSPDIDSTAVIELTEQLRALAGVEFVELNKERLAQTTQSHNQLGHYALACNAAALIIAGLLMLAFCYRGTKESRNNIELMKQLGGTLTDVRRPFLYRGPALGVLAAALGITGAAAVTLTIASMFDMSPYEALTLLKPSPTQILMFFAVVILASLTATVRFFSTNFTVYNQ